MRTISNKWINHFKEECVKSNNVRIISPFISLALVNHLLEIKRSKTIQLITRFNLNDFRQGASCLKALKKLLENGIEIKGIKNLHSKIYTFDQRSVIIASANFTSGGFFNNYEYGIISEDEIIVNDTINYFDSLWGVSNKVLSYEMIKEWEEIISKDKNILHLNKLDDYGVSRKEVVIGNRKVFVKFFGISNERCSVNEQVSDIIDWTHSHFAATFPGGQGRPIRYNDGDIVYMAYMTDDGDYAIFGKAIAIKHNAKRDIASDEDIKIKPWKKHFCIYIRIHSAIFLNTTLNKCPKLWGLMNDLQAESFRSTKERFENGEDNIEPQKSLMQKADIQLSDEGALWLDEKFKEVENTYGLVDDGYINSLYQGIPSTKNIMMNE